MDEVPDNITPMAKRCVRCKIALVFDGSSICDICFEDEFDGHAAD
jgi:hypothetical protein